MSNWMSSPCGHACQEMHVPELAGKQKLLMRLHTRKAKIRVMRGAGRSARDEAQYCVSSLDLRPAAIHGCTTEHCCSSGVNLNPKTLHSSKGLLLLHAGAPARSQGVWVGGEVVDAVTSGMRSLFNVPYTLHTIPAFFKILHGRYFLLVAPSSGILEYFFFYCCFFPPAILAWLLKLKLVLSTLCPALPPPQPSTHNIKCFTWKWKERLRYHTELLRVLWSYLSEESTVVETFIRNARRAAVWVKP